ncbi:MAG: hypothetical protein H6925_04505 [Holosporaceae bacterium]|nr:MAG: hypothetical protein H6925_04505 [Holosporaceae bacterium]
MYSGAIEALKSELTDRSDASLVHHIAQKARLVQPVDLSDPALFFKK